MIFNLFKSKPTLKELIPKGFVDIHSHIIPGIDDGAKDINESSILISEMKKMGFSKIIGTPHTYPGLYNNTNNSIQKAYEKIKILKLENIEIDFASEYMIDQSLIEKCMKKNILTIKDKHILIEFNFIGKQHYIKDLLFKIQIEGYIPVLAHPERYLYLSNLKDLILLKNCGCKFQMNLLSIVGYYGKKVLKLSEKILENNMYDYVGSDIHNINHIKLFENKVVLSNFDKVENILSNNNFFK